MKTVNQKSIGKLSPIATPCLCAALRQASRAVTRNYDDELRATGLRTTQHAVLRLLGRVGEVRKGDLGEMASLDETTLTRSLRPLEKSGWLTIRAGKDRREKMVAITDAGKHKLEQARAAWTRAQQRMQRILPEGTWDTLFATLPEVTKAVSNQPSGKKP
jgi:DNA-binding MarR family transcriptional regulator